MPSGDGLDARIKRSKEAQEQVEKLLQELKKSAGKLVKRNEELHMHAVMKEHVLDINITK